MKVALLYEFEHLAGAVVDGVASDAQLQRFNSILRESPELAQIYFEQARMHVALTLRGEGKSGAVNHLAHTAQMKKSVFRKVVQQLLPHPHRFRRVLPWLIKGGIAAVLLLVSGTVLWHVVRQPPEARVVQNVRTPDFSLNLMSCKNIRGLVTPDTLPGKISLQSGYVKIQLSSGVEMSFVGETDMDVSSDMEVTLYRGRVVTFVPPLSLIHISEPTRPY